MATNEAQEFKRKMAEYMATLDDGKYADDAREILGEFGDWLYPELAKERAVKRALDKLTDADIEALGLNHLAKE